MDLDAAVCGVGGKAKRNDSNLIGRLELGGCEIDDEWVRAHLAPGVASLTWLALYKTPITDVALECLENMPSLEYLSVESTRIGDAGARAIARYKSLKTLMLNKTLVTDDALGYVAQLPVLSALNLSDTAVSDEGLAHLSRSKSLRYLYLSRTRVVDPAMHLIALDDLESLEIEGTGIELSKLFILQGLLPMCRVWVGGRQQSSLEMFLRDLENQGIRTSRTGPTGIGRDESGARAAEIFQRAHGHMQKNEDEIALQLFRQAVQLDPSNVEYVNAAGRVLIKLERWEEAQAAFESVLAVEQENRGALLGIGNILGSTRRYEEAIAIYDLLLEADPSDGGAWFCKSLSEADMGRFAEALSSIDSCLALDSPPPFALGVRAKILAQLGR